MRSGQAWKNQGIKCEIRASLEKSGNFSLLREFFHSLVVFALSLSLHMPIDFLGQLKTAEKNVKKSGIFEKQFGKRGKVREFFLKGVLRTLYSAANL